VRVIQEKIMKRALHVLIAFLAAGDAAAAGYLWWLVEHKEAPTFLKAEGPAGKPATEGVLVHGHADGTGVTPHP
jgi:hypothetical protein